MAIEGYTAVAVAAAVGEAARAAAVAVGRAAGVAVVAGWPGLELPTRGGEDCLTLGLKLCPPRIFTIAGLDKERRKGFRNELE